MISNDATQHTCQCDSYLMTRVIAVMAHTDKHMTDRSNENTGVATMYRFCPDANYMC